MNETAFLPPSRLRVAVLSLSRSGSSLVSRMLDTVLGVDFGETIEQIPPNRNNPDGYFENADVLRLNEEVLAAAGGGVFAPPPLDYFVRNRAAFAPFTDRAAAILDYASLGRPMVGFKDPRLSLTFPVWKSARPDIVPVLVFRDPGAAALSIVDQAGIPLEQATALWFEYCYRIFLYTAGLRRYVTSFERLLSAPQEVVGDLAAHLGISIPEGEIERRLAGVVDPRRVKHSSRAEPPDSSPYIDARTKVAYSYLRRVTDERRQPDYAYFGAVLTGLAQFEHLADQRRQEQRQREDATLAERQRQEYEQLERRHDEELAVREERFREELSRLAGEHDQELAVREERFREELSRLAGEHDEELAAREERFREELSRLAGEHDEGLAAREERFREELSRLAGEHDEGLSLLREALSARQEELRGALAELTRTREAQTASQDSVARLRRRSEAAVIELERFRGRRPVRWAERWLSRADAWGATTPAFQHLVDDTLLFAGRPRFHRLRPSPNLQEVDCVTYAIRPGRPGLSGVRLAVIIDIPHAEGRLGVEIVSADSQIVGQAVVPLSQVREDEPLTLSFPAIPGTGEGRHWLRVFVRDATLPVRVFEWRRHGAGGTGPKGVRAFCAFAFEVSGPVPPVP